MKMRKQKYRKALEPIENWIIFYEKRLEKNPNNQYFLDQVEYYKYQLNHYLTKYEILE